MWREEWFGPSAARWAMQPTTKSKSGAPPPPAASVEWTDEELERQTRYFQVLPAPCVCARVWGGSGGGELCVYTLPAVLYPVS